MQVEQLLGILEEFEGGDGRFGEKKVDIDLDLDFMAVSGVEEGPE